MSKYYTPEIEEFHVGFEYEELVGLNTSPFWSKTKITIFQDLEVVSEELYSYDGKSVRVKYLDQEDIESLGFEVTDYESEGLSILRGDTFIGEFYPNTKVNTVNFFNTYFHIKNKSELIKLLKQLYIEYEEK